MTEARSHWLWVTRKEYYLDDDGSERADLSPSGGTGTGWWTCHRDTKKGDLALLYRTAPRSDVAYLFEAASDAFPLEEERPDDVITQMQLDELLAAATQDGSPAGQRYASLTAELKELDTQSDRLSAKAHEALEMLNYLSLKEERDGESNELAAEMETWEARFERISSDQVALDEQWETASDQLSDAIGNVLEAAGWDRETAIWDTGEFANNWVCEWASHMKLDHPLDLASMRNDSLRSASRKGAL